MKLPKKVSKLSLNLLSVELIGRSLLIQLGSWQVLWASNHSHRSFINCLSFFFPFFFFFDLQTLERDTGSLFNCREINTYFKRVCFLQDLPRTLFKHWVNSASDRHFRIFSPSPLLSWFSYLNQTHFHQVESEQIRRLNSATEMTV